MVASIPLSRDLWAKSCWAAFPLPTPRVQQARQFSVSFGSTGDTLYSKLCSVWFNALVVAVTTGNAHASKVTLTPHLHVRTISNAGSKPSATVRHASGKWVLPSLLITTIMSGLKGLLGDKVFGKDGGEVPVDSLADCDIIGKLYGPLVLSV